LDLIVIFGVGAVAALIGTVTGILLLRRKFKVPVSEAEFAELKCKLQASETSLTAVSANAKDLAAKLASYEAALLQSREDLGKRQQQIDAEAAEKQKEKVQRSAAEKRALEISAQLAAVIETCAELEAQVKQERDRVAEAGSRLGSVEGELDAAKKRNQEIAEQAARFAAESIEFKHQYEVEGRMRLDRDEQLNTERETVRQLSRQIVELQNERSQLEIKLREEMGSAVKGMELLVMAQQKLSSAFKVLGPDGQNGCITEGTPTATLVSSEPPQDAEALVSSSQSS